MTVPSNRRNAADPFASPGAGGGGGDAFEFDFDGVRTGSSFSIPVGVWPAKIMEVARGTSNAGNAKLVWTVRVVGGAHQGKQQQFHTALTERAMWKVKETTDALGFETIPGTNRVRFTPAEAVGRVCAMVVEEQAGTDGVVRPQISRLMHWSEFADEPMFVETAERLGIVYQEEEGEAAPPAPSVPSGRRPGVPR